MWDRLSDYVLHSAPSLKSKPQRSIPSTGWRCRERRENRVFFSCKLEIRRLLLQGFWVVFCLCLCAGPISATEIPRSLVKFLSGEFTLVRIPEAGTTEYFRITRIDITLNAEGQISGRSRSEGIFKRTVVYVKEDSTRMDRYTWKSFSTGRTEGTTDSLYQSEVSAIHGFTYDITSTDLHSVPPIQIGGLAKTSDTFAFFIVAWDVATFSHVVSVRPSYPLWALTRIGDRVSETQQRTHAPFDFTPVVSNFTYTRHGLSSTFTGLTYLGKIPCAIIRFESYDNPVAFDFASDAMKIHIKGTDWIRGDIWLSLIDKNVYRGELHSTMVASQTAVTPGRQIEFPVTVRQQVILERITAKEYEQD